LIRVLWPGDKRQLSHFAVVGGYARGREVEVLAVKRERVVVQRQLDDRHRLVHHLAVRFIGIDAPRLVAPGPARHGGSAPQPPTARCVGAGPPPPASATRAPPATVAPSGNASRGTVPRPTPRIARPHERL